MFGQNPVAKSEIEGDGYSLHVVNGSPFYTIQGEGPFAGHPAVFLRLHGCPLRCFFCDTNFSNPADLRRATTDIVNDIQAIRNQHPHCNLLVITGGEPVRQNLEPLVTMLLPLSWDIQVETAGILWQPILEEVYVVVSPKTPAIDRRIAQTAHAFKYVVQAGHSYEDGLPLTNTQIQDGRQIKLARPWDFGADSVTIYLSPMDEGDEEKNRLNRQEVGRLAMAYGYKAGLQLHKFFDLP